MVIKIYCRKNKSNIIFFFVIYFDSCEMLLVCVGKLSRLCRDSRMF